MNEQYVALTRHDQLIDIFPTIGIALITHLPEDHGFDDRFLADHVRDAMERRRWVRSARLLGTDELRFYAPFEFPHDVRYLPSSFLTFQRLLDDHVGTGRWSACYVTDINQRYEPLLAIAQTPEEVGLDISSAVDDWRDVRLIEFDVVPLLSVPGQG